MCECNCNAECPLRGNCPEDIYTEDTVDWEEYEDDDNGEE